MIAALAAHDTHFSFRRKPRAPGLRRAGRAVPLAADAAAGGPRPLGRTHSRAGDVLHDDHHLAQQGQGHRPTGATPTTGRRTASSRSSSTCRGRRRSRSSWPPASTRTCGACSASTAGGRSIRWRSRATWTATGPTSRARAASSPWRATSTSARDTGWFSDRSACYLAAGRPVITQETGFSKFLPTGKGLFGFRTMDDVLAAVDAIESDYEGNCRAAREIAAEYFAAEKVVGSLMERAGLEAASGHGS